MNIKVKKNIYLLAICYSKIHYVFYPLKRIKEMKECYDILEKKYPNWKQNVYYQKQSKGYKILCLLISKRLYFISRILIKYKMKGA